LIPLESPCSGIKKDTSTPSDPYWQNPVITSTFTDFLGYKNSRNGAIAEYIGDLRFVNFKVADNILAGIEMTKLALDYDESVDLYFTRIQDALVVGNSENTDDTVATQRGIITAQTEGMLVENVNFYNLSMGIGSCSHCFHPAATDSGARTVAFSGLYFDSSVDQRINYQYPYRAIYWDMDGSLTDLEANSYATPYWQHNYEVDTCSYDETNFNGLICDATYQVR
jgi:uncharacterized protein (UPF0212 family)